MRLQIEKQLNKQLVQTFRYHKGWLVPLFLAVPVVPIALVKSLSPPSQPTPQPTNLQVNLGMNGFGQVTHAPANAKTPVKAQTKAQKQPQKHSTNSQAKTQQSHSSTHPRRSLHPMKASWICWWRLAKGLISSELVHPHPEQLPTIQGVLYGRSG